MAANTWINYGLLDGCRNPSLKIEDFYGRPCHIGLACGNTGFVFSIVLIFRREVAGGPLYEVFQRATLGIEPDGVCEALGAYDRQFSIRAIVYDPFTVRPLLASLDERLQAFLVEAQQTVRCLSPALKELMGAVHGGRFRFATDRLLDHALSALQVRDDPSGNVWPVFGWFGEPASALINGMAMAGVPGGAQ